jgi:hypothetical protein
MGEKRHDKGERNTIKLRTDDTTEKKVKKNKNKQSGRIGSKYGGFFGG